ncbi:hypothetical protein PGT21_029022 [Puccinia graminis f. sp. tritici]|uniref:TFA2 Winged helix domain-containing protein n=1 Tax=Puccinia graminis f. sp. tritici TaxID=56615 RepID=A0A5B0PWB9_PUCGR|nr:hypothetical protein PGT21_029022 [Puccinia graminis f. sp. tritici]
MASKFPSLPAPRFAPPKPSPLSQPATTAPPEPPKSQPQPSANAPSSSAPPKKKKKKNAQPTAPPVVEDLGPGKQFATQVFKLVDTLKRTNGPMNLSDLEAQTGVRGLLSEHTDVPFNKELFDAFNSHERVNVTEKGLVRLWSYKPDYVINNPKQVLELLERFSGMGGMPVNTLKQSWPNVMTAITELENEGKVLVLRTESVGAKEGTPKTVFYDQLGCRENLGPTRGALDDGKLLPLSPRDNKKHNGRSHITTRTLSHLNFNKSVCKFYQTERKSPPSFPFFFNLTHPTKKKSFERCGIRYKPHQSIPCHRSYRRLV